MVSPFTFGTRGWSFFVAHDIDSAFASAKAKIDIGIDALVDYIIRLGLTELCC